MPFENGSFLTCLENECNLSGGVIYLFFFWPTLFALAHFAEKKIRCRQVFIKEKKFGLNKKWKKQICATHLKLDMISSVWNTTYVWFFFLDCKLQIVKLFLVIMSIVYFCKMLPSHMTTYADILRHSSNWPRNNFCWAFKVLC